MSCLYFFLRLGVSKHVWCAITWESAQIENFPFIFRVRMIGLITIKNDTQNAISFAKMDVDS